MAIKVIPIATKNAFTLVEIAVVMVVVALIAGGVLAARSFIRSSELLTLTASFQRYQAATYAFRDKYSMYPGDMPTASSVWGIAAGTTGDDTPCANQPSTDIRTCNGNGDGWIESNAIAFGERFRAWQHLANAGFILGNFTGVPVTGPPIWSVTPGAANVPAGKMPGTAFMFTGLSNVAAVNNRLFPTTAPGNILGVVNTSNKPFLTPLEAWGIDTKFDDGRPGTGKAFVYKHTSEICATTDDATTALYNFANRGMVCSTFWLRL